MKLIISMSKEILKLQPPSGGCVLKLLYIVIAGRRSAQPPSGGCVLKHVNIVANVFKFPPAAFRRLCVETR